MNIDEFLDRAEESSSSNTQNKVSSPKQYSQESTSNYSSWGDQVQHLTSQINEAIADDDYNTALAKYMELKELPTKIVETDLKIQEHLQEELNSAHAKLTHHMEAQQKKHEETSNEIKQLVALAYEELANGNEVTASNLYGKACGTFNQLPKEFRERNSRAHYDILKLYFSIKEFHDKHLYEEQQHFVDSFNASYKKALGALQSKEYDAVVQIHDVLHDKVLTLPNEEVRLKAELLDRLVGLKNRVAYETHQTGHNIPHEVKVQQVPQQTTQNNRDFSEDASKQMKLAMNKSAENLQKAIDSQFSKEFEDALRAKAAEQEKSEVKTSSSKQDVPKSPQVAQSTTDEPSRESESSQSNSNKSLIDEIEADFDNPLEEEQTTSPKAQSSGLASLAKTDPSMVPELEGLSEQTNQDDFQKKLENTSPLKKINEAFAEPKSTYQKPQTPHPGGKVPTEEVAPAVKKHRDAKAYPSSPLGRLKSAVMDNDDVELTDSELGELESRAKEIRNKLRTLHKSL